jgi:tetratricopeptide (TPR) repeat protein
MPDDARVDEILKELLDSGSTPEEVCRTCPELLAPVRSGWHKLRALQAQVGALFPESPSLDRANPNVTRPHAPPTAELPQIQGHEVQELLGHGGVGVVYKAWHVRLHRPVAVKMLLAGVYAQPQELQRFLHEAETVAALRHANIVQVHEAGDVDGRPYFTMEFVEGGSLAQELAGTPQPARQAAALVASVAEAVHAAHQCGIVHRDLKPGNILLTADGTPKLTDFGLARRLEGTAGLTQTGVPVGTPSYMAPEQAQGKAHDVGPAADTYALGAIVYELLTGRPPFRAETAAETLRQAVSRDPVLPSRLNAAVPRDLETICLKCLEKDPQRRYPSAAALAEDLQRFQRNEPIVARPVGPLERGLRWARRNPTGAALAATALALVGLAFGGGVWLVQLRTERREETARREERESQAVKAALEKAASLQQEGRWPEAQAAFEDAQRLLADSTQIGLVNRVSRAREDAEMVAKLEEIRLRVSEGGRSQALSPENMYADAFRDYGIPILTLEPAAAAARVRASSIGQTLLAFMHDWLLRVPDENKAWLRDVLDRADDDNWRHAFREALVEKDEEKLRALVRAPEALAQPPGVVSGLAAAMLLNMYKDEAQAFMREAQQRHPGDFWINYLLGCFWWEDYPQEAVGYFRVAVAIRPTSDGAYLMLGRALRGVGDREGALAAFRQSVALNPGFVVARELVWALARGGELEEARAAWAKFLERNPPDHDSWYGYAQLCLFLGNERAYRRNRNALLAHFGDTTNDWIVAERTSLACLLLPEPGDELQGAIRLADLAVAAGERSSEPGNAYLRFVKGLAVYRQGRPEEAIPLLQEAAEKLPNRAGPRLALAMAQFQSGRAIEARKTLAAAVRAYDWDEPRGASKSDQPTVWVCHVLRREAEAMLLPNLPAFLQGNYQPQDNDERIALLGICQARALTGAAARLYADAFAADPHLADELTAECLRRTRAPEPPPHPIEAFNAACRYLAARCAVSAGCGLDRDGEKLSPAERTRWREQAREWLRADLAMWAAKLDGDSPWERSLAKRMLASWLADPDLAGVREPHALDDLSLDEREHCLALWHDVRALLKSTGHNPATAALDPKRTRSQEPSPSILIRLGRLNAARVVWKSALEADPPEHDVWNGYAELCLFLGQEEEYRRARRALLERFGTTTNPFYAERTARACMLLPATEDELRQAAALAQRAVAVHEGDKWGHPYFEFVHGLAEYRQGQFGQAITTMRGDASKWVGPCPKLVLAMALHQKGQADEARKTLASAVLSHDWTANQVRDTHSCIAHSLRREAESMILPNLPAFMDGKYQPQDNDERLALLGVCQFMNRTRTMARLYADAFAVAPSLADDLDAGYRYNAARAAALAGCGHGADATGLGEEERARCREQARQWLRADLAARARALGAGSTATRGANRMALTRWRNEPDLACVREPGELDKLSADERKEYLALWAEVAAVLARTQK